MLSLLPLAAAAPDIVYDLSMNGETVGTRQLTVTTIAREGSERRVVEAVTELTVAGVAVVCRSTGAAGSRGASFTTAVDQGGSISQVQGVQIPGGGWRVIVSDGYAATESTLDAALTTLDLMDPERSRALAAVGPAGVLLVETGQLVSGTLGEPTEGTLTIAGEKVRVVRYTLTGPAGRARFDLDPDGFLLRSELQWLGGTVVATARALPPPRSFGEIQEIEPSEGSISEERL